MCKKAIRDVEEGADVQVECDRNFSKGFALFITNNPQHYKLANADDYVLYRKEPVKKCRCQEYTSYDLIPEF